MKILAAVFGIFALAGALIWPEFFFGVFLAPTRFRFLSSAYLPSYISPYHLLFSALVIATGMRAWHSQKPLPHIPSALWMPYAALLLVMALGLMLGEDSAYGISKTAEVASICLYAAFGAFFLYRGRTELRALFACLVLFGTGLSALAAASTGLVHATATSVAGLGSNYVLVQQMAGCGALILMYHVLPSERWGWRQAGAWLLLLLSLAGVILPGGKGPVLSFALTMLLAVCFYLITSGWKVRERLWKLALLYPALMVLASAVFLAIYGGKVRVFMRIKDTLARISSGGITDLSIIERIENLRTAWRMFLEHPLIGGGPGSFAARAPRLEGLDPAFYPHNIAAELLAETGLAGALAFACMVGFSLWKLHELARKSSSTLPITGFGLLSYVLLCAMTSQDLGNPALFFCIALPYLIERIEPEAARKNLN